MGMVWAEQLCAAIEHGSQSCPEKTIFRVPLVWYEGGDP